MTLTFKEITANKLFIFDIRYLFFVLILSGCEVITVKDGGGQRPAPKDEQKDSGPKQPVDVSHIPEPIPREELRTIAGNVSPYKVMGRTYRLIKDPTDYKERGIASWYGKKFHGRKTSNGELYNMYGMTAAHKTLPIPSYVRVTNISNKRSIVVRVNDRGPFHGGRIIDLTYTAAKKLGYQKWGTAEVIVEYIDPKQHRSSVNSSNVGSPASANPSNEPKAPTPINSAGYALPANTFLQLGAFSQVSSAKALRAKVVKMTSRNVLVVAPEKEQKLFKVRVGPFGDNLELSLFREKLIKAKFPAPHVIYP